MKKTNNEEIQTRRDFFKQTSRKVLPVLAAFALYPLMNSCDKDLWEDAQTADDSASASNGNTNGSCSECSNSCSYRCGTSCSNTCDFSCKTRCTTGCKWNVRY